MYINLSMQVFYDIVIIGKKAKGITILEFFKKKSDFYEIIYIINTQNS